MSQNIEIKAKLSARQYEDTVARAKELTGKPPTEIYQKDIFFDVPSNRLKLRQFADDTAELIAYARQDCLDPAPSNYYRIEIERPDDLLQGLTMTLGVRGVVEKRRLLFIHEQTRIHLDSVTDLGTFMELEVVLADGQSHASGVETADSLMRELSIDKESLVAAAYIDLLEQK